MEKNIFTRLNFVKRHSWTSKCFVYIKKNSITCSIAWLDVKNVHYMGEKSGAKQLTTYRSSQLLVVNSKVLKWFFQTHILKTIDYWQLREEVEERRKMLFLPPQHITSLTFIFIMLALGLEIIPNYKAF